ncbi:hypothetical protein SAMN05216191_101526 [Paenibacillus jilunlii]|uniref:Uncharacterized protein n=1 Tax=Paenibacillus jilunlii TaxID=682956 RepID=A0A1G9GS03_9BACL|nr:hypothetical protein AML91_16630 [Paenibacillus jilunlii]SDL03053.1 hypothetical protein SAMN05216191_101526 [Paenibacillus jilunlii]
MGYAIAFLIICVIAGLYNKSKEDQAKSLRELRAKSKTDYYDSLSQLSTNSEEGVYVQMEN